MDKKVLIQSVKISSFKNLTNREFTFEKGKVVLLEGKNGIGKSNCINAIYWCLTGVDLNNSIQDADFIPKSLRDKFGIVIDVEVTLNVMKVRRVTERTSKGLSQSLFINDIKCESLKRGEMDIDCKLGLLPYTLSNYTNKNFDMRRFALNPCYIYSLAPKDIRDVIVKKLVKETDTANLDKELLKETLIKETLQKYVLLELPDLSKSLYQNLCSANAIAGEKLKKLAKRKEELEHAKAVVESIDANSSMVNEIKKVLMNAQKEYNEVESDCRVLSAAVLRYETELDKISKITNKLVGYSLIETNSRGIDKSALHLISNDVELKHRSTSEEIYDAINLMTEYFMAVGLETALPIFIDRAESMNLSKIYYLLSGRNQVFATKVNESYTDEIEVEIL